MAKKIFVSYKHLDSNVRALSNVYGVTTVRNYVDEVIELLKDDHIFKGEDDGEDMSTLHDSTIASKLGDKIFDSSVTIVLISKGMKEFSFIKEKDQWIPWEISYSLKEQKRQSGRSKTNAVLAVVLPDEFGSYNYFIEDNTCPYCNCRTLKTDFLFQILRDNMFNVKVPVYTDCSNHVMNKPYKGYSSYIYSVKWEDFREKYNRYIDIAVEIKENIEQYKIEKTIQ